MIVIREFSITVFMFLSGLLGLNAEDCSTGVSDSQGAVYICASTVTPSRARR